MLALTIQTAAGEGRDQSGSSESGTSGVVTEAEHRAAQAKKAASQHASDKNASEKQAAGSTKDAASSGSAVTDDSIEKALAKHWKVDENGEIVRLSDKPIRNALVEEIIRITQKDLQMKELFAIKEEVRQLRGYIQFTWLGMLILFVAIMFRTRQA